MKTYQHCPKCQKQLQLIGYFGLVAVARCNCDYAAPGAEDSEFWRGIHIMQSGWKPAEESLCPPN